MPFEELRNLLDSELANTSVLTGPRDLDNRTFQSITEHLTCRLLEVNNLVLSPQQFLLESIRGSEVALQKIRVFVQRRPSRRPIFFTQCAPTLNATLVSHRFHDIQSLVLAHHGPCTALCPSLCVLGLLRQALQAHSLPDPTIPQLRRRRNHTSLRNTHSKCRHSRRSPEKSEGLPNSRQSANGRSPRTVVLTNITHRPFSDLGFMTFRLIKTQGLRDVHAMCQCL